jgi:uncharacterized integral membrane protein
MKNIKIILITLILGMAVVVSLQNTQDVKTKFLFTTITLPRVQLLLSTFGLGYFSGLITPGLLRSRSDKSKG